MPTLTAEKTINVSGGLTAKLNKQNSLTIDAYWIQIKNRIVLSGSYDRINPGIDSILKPYANLNQIAEVSFFSNAINTRTFGTDLVLNGFYNFTHQLGVYGNFFYLSNPREVNGTSTARGGTASATAKKYNTDVMSVPDLYMARGGVAFMVDRFTFSGGIRIEGLPSTDLLGGSKGFRRPGYIISAEPSVTLVTKKASFNISVPWALQRNRTQSNSDKRRTADTGTHMQGDAAFADYLVSAGLTFRL